MKWTKNNNLQKLMEEKTQNLNRPTNIKEFFLHQ